MNLYLLELFRRRQRIRLDDDDDIEISVLEFGIAAMLGCAIIALASAPAWLPMFREIIGW